MNEKHSERQYKQTGDNQFSERFTFVTDPVLHTLSLNIEVLKERENTFVICLNLMLLVFIKENALVCDANLAELLKLILLRAQ